MKDDLIMIQRILLFIAFSFIFGQSFGQSDTSSVYKNLEIRRFYSVQLFSQISNDKGIYEVNGKRVSKSTYEKYDSTWKNMTTCCPCILKKYNEKDVLIREGVYCQDCGVGIFKEFYPNGNVKLSGAYKENPTGNWENISERRYCQVQYGQWVYYKENGDTLYSEYWNDGEFIKQVPEQSKMEIWKVDLTLNGESVKGKTLTPEQIKQLVITPHFKNSSRKNIDFILKFEVSEVGYISNEKTFTIDSFKQVDISQMISKIGVPKGKVVNGQITLCNHGEIITFFNFQIKR
jgi:hypothetical protein